MSQALDNIAPSFYAAKNRWPDAPNMQAHYEDLAKTFEENGSSLLELCKSFLEMVCITVLSEIGEPLPGNNPSTTQFLVAVLDKLGLRNTRGASAFDKVLSVHNKLADALTEVRNQEGSVAHGKDGFLDVMSDRHARVYLLSADTIISLILNAYEGVEPSILHTREKHTRYKYHNDKIDAGTVVNAEVDEDGMLVLSFRAGSQREGEGIELRTPTSELLYYLDRQAYMDVIVALRGVTPTETDAEPDDVEIELEETQTPTVSETETPADVPTEATASPHLEAITEYSGRYVDQVNPLYEFIIHSLLNGKSEQAAHVQNLTYTLLNGMEDLGMVDWSTRESTRSAVRVFVKKLFSLFAIDGLGPEALEGIVSWLAGQIVGGEA